MKAGVKRKKRSVVILAVSAVIFLIAQSLSGFFLVQIIGRMNRSADQNLLTSSRVISEGLNNKIAVDRELVVTLTDLLAMEPENVMEETLREYAGSTDFFRFSYVNAEGEGIDSQGNFVQASDFPFDEPGISEGRGGLSAPYYGSSGRIQITYRCPVRKDGKQTGVIYADRIVNDYNLPTLFSFHNGEGSAYVVDSSGNFIIKSKGTAAEEDVYSYLEKQGNSESVQERSVR